MTQSQINTQYLRIAKTVVKAYKAIDEGLITEVQFNSKLKCADQARVTMRIAQNRFNHLGY